MRRLLCLMAVSSSLGCTAVDFARVPTRDAGGPFFITQSSVTAPYESLGLVQVTRRGVRAFGFADPAGTDLDAAVAELELTVKGSGADGVMNARVEMQQYTTAEKIVGLVLFFLPLPAEVTITGELIRFRRAPASPPQPQSPAVPL